MKFKKYTLEILLLYLENKLSPQLAQEISNYLLQDKEMFNYIIKLSQIKSYTKVKENKIFIEQIKDQWYDVCFGAVELLEQKKLVFRGEEDSFSYNYLFYGVNLRFVKHGENDWDLYLDTEQKSLTIELLTNKMEFLIQKKLVKPLTISLSPNQSYYFFVKNNRMTERLEIFL